MRQKTRWFGSILVAALPLVLACQPAQEQAMEEEAQPVEQTETAQEEMPPMEAEEPGTAAVQLMDREGTEVGMVTFTGQDGSVQVVASLEGLEPGQHGFHIHETGDCSADDFTSAGGHFNPTGVEHGCPGDEVHHAGDLGNVEIVEDGTGNLDVTSSMISLGQGPSSVLGRAVVVHQGEDDCTSQPSGAAGPRVACGVIEEAEARMEEEAGTTGDEEEMEATGADDEGS
ncbi:MAG: superoxide dismutase family protein [Thermoanaerobaculia bacterium]|nr:superoxide dismutase family protein [Thermoanaerobaculia bacterium]